MDFNDSPEEAAWRAECRDWLEDNAPAVTGSSADFMEVGGPDDLARARTWQRMKFEAGLTKITWEPEFGGRNGTSMQQVIFNQEEAHYDVPSAAFVIGLGMIAPTLKACGTDAQRDRYLTKLLRGEEIWCQMFSEPGAGSDVASLSTTAVARRRRVGGQRPEGVDLRRAVLRLRRDHLPHRIRTRRSTRASPRSSSTCKHPA